MDDDLLALLVEIQAGDVTDPGRCRTAFCKAERALRDKLGALYAQQDVLRAAQAAFLEGWPDRGLRISG